MTVRTVALGKGGKAKRNTRRDAVGPQQREMIGKPKGSKLAPMLEQKRRAKARKHAKT